MLAFFKCFVQTWDQKNIHHKKLKLQSEHWLGGGYQQTGSIPRQVIYFYVSKGQGRNVLFFGCTPTDVPAIPANVHKLQSIVIKKKNIGNNYNKYVRSTVHCHQYVCIVYLYIYIRIFHRDVALPCSIQNCIQAVQVCFLKAQRILFSGSAGGLCRCSRVGFVHLI